MCLSTVDVVAVWGALEIRWLCAWGECFCGQQATNTILYKARCMLVIWCLMSIAWPNLLHILKFFHDKQGSFGKVWCSSAACYAHDGIECNVREPRPSIGKIACRVAIGCKMILDIKKTIGHYKRKLVAMGHLLWYNVSHLPPACLSQREKVNLWCPMLRLCSTYVWHSPTFFVALT